jgi:hypothetical protein
MPTTDVMPEIEPLANAEGRAIVAIGRYVAARHARVAGFVDCHFSLIGGAAPAPPAARPRAPGDSEAAFHARDHDVARIFDLIDLARATYRTM